MDALTWLCGPPVALANLPGVYLVADPMGCAANLLSVGESVLLILGLPWLLRILGLEPAVEDPG